MSLEIFDASEGVPEFYIDSARIAGNAFTVVLELGIQMNATAESDVPPPTRRTAIVRMSPQHALALRDLLTKNLAVYETALGQLGQSFQSAEGNQ